MRQLLPLAIALAAPLATAQNCFDPNWGTMLATNVQDTVLPIQSIGFPFPIGANTYTDIHITDHGFVQLSNAGVPAPDLAPLIYTPTAANLVFNAPKVCALFADIIAINTGEIWLSTTASRCTITWHNVSNFGSPTVLFDLQLILYPSGDFRAVFGPGVTNASTFGGSSDNGICGVTPGGGAAIPASSDISAGGSTTVDTTYEAWITAMTFDLAVNSVLFVRTNPGYTFVALGAPANCGTSVDSGTGCDGMSLTGVGRAAIGNPNFILRTSGVPAVSPVSFVAFGTTALPGVPLASIGMAGCFGYQNLDIGMFQSGPIASGVSDFVLSIPDNVSLVGASLATQGVALSLATTLGLAASNGTVITIGYGAN